MNRFFGKIQHIIFAVLGTAIVAGAIVFFVFYGGNVSYLFFGGARNIENTTNSTSTSYGDDSVSQSTRPSNKRLPERRWDMLDPKVNAQAVLIQSLDEDFPFFRYRTREVWPAASLTKLLTAVVVLENFGDKKKIPITSKAMTAEGVAGGLSSGEVYISGDLLKVMLLSSSNRAAAAFEEFGGGKTEFNRMLNKKAGEIEMKDTILNDASGLSDLNITTAADMFLLVKYIYENHPEILNWTRLGNYLVQPFNTSEFRTIYNIHPFVNDKMFLGGKTGTSDVAIQNLISVFSFQDFRIAVIILGSPDRVGENNYYLDWIRGAYEF